MANNSESLVDLPLIYYSLDFGFVYSLAISSAKNERKRFRVKHIKMICSTQKLFPAFQNKLIFVRRKITVWSSKLFCRNEFSEPVLMKQSPFSLYMSLREGKRGRRFQMFSSWKLVKRAYNNSDWWADQCLGQHISARISLKESRLPCFKHLGNGLWW